ncbi:MAG: M48 family metalloprotease [Betaproteobacteria bacterium]|nr:M48 family metalloprotease [Betaproteobacteria bacterium]
MLQTDFDKLFEHARQRAMRSPRLFRLRVTLRATAGVGIFVLLGLLGVLVALWALAPLASGELPAASWPARLKTLLAVPTVGISLICMRILRGHFPAPDGIPLARKEAPRLFAMLDRMAASFAAPKIDDVRVVGELNAAIAQRPGRFFGFGLRNTLIFGLPLTLAVTPAQFEAVIAHEFGHLRRQRIALGGWGAHMRALWHQVLTNMENETSRLRPFVAAIAHFESPIYCAQSLVLSHLDEFEADQAAAEVVGAPQLGRALAEVALKHRFLADDYWRKVYAQADHAKQPAFLPYSHMLAALRAGYDQQAVASWFDELIEEPVAPSLGTHPSLLMRVRALGLDDPAKISPRGGEHYNAAEYFLGDALARLAVTLDRQWWHAERGSWRRRHREVSSALGRIERIENGAGPLDITDRLELALLVERYDGERDPLMFYRDVLPDARNRPEAFLAMGRLLLMRGDASGVSYLRRALAQDNSVALQAAAMLVEYYEGSDDASAEEIETQRRHLSRLLRQASRVQETLDAPLGALRCVTSGLEMFELRSLVRVLRRHELIQSAYVVRRHCELAPRWRAYLLVLCVPPGMLETVEPIAQEIEAGIAVAGMWRVHASVQGSAEEHLLAKVRHSKIYSRKRGGMRGAA